MELVDYKNVCVKQNKRYNCGPACLVSIALFYGLNISIDKIEQYTNTEKQGTNIEGTIKGAEQVGFDAKGVRGDLDSLNKIPLPAIAHTLINQNSANSHYVVIYKINAEFVEIMNPLFGVIENILLVEFNKIWTGILVLMIPTNSN